MKKPCEALLLASFVSYTGPVIRQPHSNAGYLVHRAHCSLMDAVAVRVNLRSLNMSG